MAENSLCAANTDCSVNVLEQIPVILCNLTPQKYYGIVEWLSSLLDMIGVIVMGFSEEDLL